MSLRLLPIVLALALAACTIQTQPVEPQPSYVAVGAAPASTGGEVMVVEQNAQPATSTATAPPPTTATVASGGDHPPIQCGGSQDIVLDGIRNENIRFTREFS